MAGPFFLAWLQITTTLPPSLALSDLNFRWNFVLQVDGDGLKLRLPHKRSSCDAQPHATDRKGSPRYRDRICVLKVKRSRQHLEL